MLSSGCARTCGQPVNGRWSVWTEPKNPGYPICSIHRTTGNAHVSESCVNEVALCDFWFEILLQYEWPWCGFKESKAIAKRNERSHSCVNLDYGESDDGQNDTSTAISARVEKPEAKKA